MKKLSLKMKLLACFGGLSSFLRIDSGRGLFPTAARKGALVALASRCGHDLWRMRESRPGLLAMAGQTIRLLTLA